MKLALFDCDGTLVDSGGLIHEVMARTFEAFDLQRPPLSATKSIIGL
ncbi:MAG: HAD family hydrolase, partial [Ensifer adhaerens]|nr:HAD family hydrolase [Ensifer adhaerens]